MTSVDSDRRFHASELSTPLNGEFSGKDILSLAQFDRVSRDLLFTYAHQMELSLAAKQIPQSLRGTVVISFVPENEIKSAALTNRVSFEAAALRMGAKNTLTTPLPNSKSPYFDSDILNIVGSLPDIILLNDPTQRIARRILKALRTIPERAPLINSAVFEPSNRFRDDPRWGHYRDSTNGLPTKMALLALVLRKA